MTPRRRRELMATALLAATLAPAQPSAVQAQSCTMPEIVQTTTQPSHPYAGMWVTRDGNIRHELLPNGRYDEQRGTRRSAYRGRYEVRGNYIEYWDDTGFTADGTFVSENELHHGGMVFLREK